MLDGPLSWFSTNGEKMRSPRIKWTGFVGAFALVGMSLLSACGDNNSSSSITQPQVNEKVTESSSSVDEGSSVIVSEADECRMGSKKFPENYCCQYYGVQCAFTPKSSSSVESSSSVASDVSAVWTGKMEMPKTQTIDGKSYMIIETAEELAYFADQVTNKGNERLNARLVKNIRLNVDNMVDENGNLLVDALTLNVILRTLRRVHSCQDDLRRVLTATNNVVRVRDNVRVQFIYAQVTRVRTIH